MNPYDFARIEWNKPPERHKPVWHHRLTGEGEQQLYSGSIELDIYTETPLFIADPRSVPADPRRAALSIKNKHNQYIIPGSSLKGMLRTVVETISNGCLTLYDGSYEHNKVNYRRAVPAGFQKCSDNTNLCIACRIFGMLRERTEGVFLGKVNIGDALVIHETLASYGPMYTAALVDPKPRHADFYLDPSRAHIAGRKFYFHHHYDDLLTAENLLPTKTGGYYNRYIDPIDKDTGFHVRIDFTNLEQEEFGAFLYALTLEQTMRHKIGYGKPLGLGSILITPTSLTLIDYTARYRQSEAQRGKTTWEDKDVWTVIYDQVDEFSKTHLAQEAMKDLQRIWAWPPDSSVEYYYPSKRDWFDTPASQGKRIAQTRNVPRQR
ncbi:MAG TPA: RAMP superfamily CRISPR-associated protein [Ktedonobacteraceae bacterium]|nr:RAMP superfamily CRISPR-associated protein [Ktedonobacteraceae bacterium]